MILTIDKPTRLNHNSAILIDNILVTDLSDHFSQFCIISSALNKIKHAQRKIRDYSKLSGDGFNNDIGQIDWQTLIQDPWHNLDKRFSTFHINKLVNKHAPLTRIAKRNLKQFSKPWITILRSIKIKNKQFYTANDHKYKVHRNCISLLTRASKKLYYEQYETSNMKKT